MLALCLFEENHFKMKIKFMLIFLVFYGNVWGYNSKNPYLLAPKGANLRMEANVEAKVLGRIPFGTKIKIIQKTTQTVELEGLKGFWVKVNYQEKIGFLVDVYLSDMPPPPANCKNLKMYAQQKLGFIGKAKSNTEKKKAEGVGMENTFFITKTTSYTCKHQAIYELQEEDNPHIGKYEIEYLLVENLNLQEAFLLARLCTGVDLSDLKFELNEEEKDGKRVNFVNFGFTLKESPWVVMIYPLEGKSGVKITLQAIIN